MILPPADGRVASTKTAIGAAADRRNLPALPALPAAGLVVTAQAAAIERKGWLPVLRRSWALTEGSLLHVVFFDVCIGLITILPGLLIDSALPDETDVGSFLVGVGTQVLIISFTALATALLYFDLRARRRFAAVAWQESQAG